MTSNLCCSVQSLFSCSSFVEINSLLFYAARDGRYGYVIFCYFRSIVSWSKISYIAPNFEGLCLYMICRELAEKIGLNNVISLLKATKKFFW